MDALTLIYPYYSQPQMLARQCEEWNRYPHSAQIILVDDGSPQPAEPIVLEHASYNLLTHLRLYRVLVDVPWARSTARNLGAQEATTDYIVQLDLDHVIPVECLPALLDFVPQETRYYRFPRWRVGRADATRRKDALPDDCRYGRIKEHMDSYLVSRRAYWEAGGYDERTFNGVLAGGSEFLARLERVVSRDILPDPIRSEVYTRDIISDASVTQLNRDTGPGKVRWQEKRLRKQGKPTERVILPWERLL